MDEMNNASGLFFPLIRLVILSFVVYSLPYMDIYLCLCLPYALPFPFLIPIQRQPEADLGQHGPLLGENYHYPSSLSAVRASQL